MPALGINMIGISAGKKDFGEGGVKVNNRANITDVKERELPNLNTKGLIVTFDYKTEYISSKNGKSVAEIAILGEVYVIEQNLAEIMEKWKKEKKLPENVNIHIINTILRKCITKAIVLSEDLMLPSPIALPYASKRKTEDSRYIG